MKKNININQFLIVHAHNKTTTCKYKQIPVNFAPVMVVKYPNRSIVPRNRWWFTSGFLPSLIIAWSPIYFFTDDVRRRNCTRIRLLRTQRRTVLGYCSVEPVAFPLHCLECNSQISLHCFCLLIEGTFGSAAMPRRNRSSHTALVYFSSS